MPVLTHTLPLSSLFLVWDAIFSGQARDKDSNPKLDFFLDICTSMIIRTKPALYRYGGYLTNCLLVFTHLRRLGNITQKGPSLWTADEDQLFDDALMKGVSLLQPFNLSNAGGIERVLQMASDLSQRRSRESITRQANPSLRDRLGVNMWKDFTTSQRLPSNENPMDVRNGTDSKNSDTSAASSNSSFVSQITNTVWKGITNQTAMEIPSTPTSPTIPIPHSPEPEANPQTTSKMWSYAEKLKGSNTIATLSKMSSNWRARALLSSSGGSLPLTNNVSDKFSHRHAKQGSNSYEQDSPRTSSSFSTTRSPDLPVETSAEGSPPQSNKSLLEKTRTLLSPRSPPSTSPPKSAPRPLLLTSTLVTSGQSGLKSHRNLKNKNSSNIPDPEEWADVMREKQHYICRDSLSSTSSLSPSDRYVRTPKSTTSDRESDTSSSRIVSLNRRSVSPMAPNFRLARERMQSRTSSKSSGFTSPPTLPHSPLQDSRKTSARIASTSESPSILQTYPPPSDPNGSRTTASHLRESDDSDATSNERPSSVIRLTEAEDAELSIQASRVRSKRYPRLPNLSIPDGHKPHTSVEEKSLNPSQLTVEWPQHEIEADSTPRKSRFESEEDVPVSRKLSRSPQTLRKKLSTGELGHQRKVSVDTIRDFRQRKVSNSHRPRKISTESREVPKSSRDSSAEEGDDEGYDELLSAYESEDGPRSSLENY